jgi:hypothetical protein
MPPRPREPTWRAIMSINGRWRCWIGRRAEYRGSVKHSLVLDAPFALSIQDRVEVDADVLAWLKSKEKGYQTRINAIVREAMLREIGKR